MENVARVALLIAYAILCIAIGVAGIFYTRWVHRLTVRLGRCNKVLSCLAPEWYERYLEWSEHYLESKVAYFSTRISGIGWIFMGLVVLLATLLCSPRTP